MRSGAEEGSEAPDHSIDLGWHLVAEVDACEETGVGPGCEFWGSGEAEVASSVPKRPRPLAMRRREAGAGVILPFHLFQNLDGRGVLELAREIEGGDAGLGTDRGIGAAVEEELHHGGAGAGGGFV